jgi:hypothetical protein
VGASTAGVRGREVRDWGLTGGVCGAERGNERMREGIGVDRPSPPGSGRERRRESARARTRAVASRWVHLSGDAGARVAWLGRAGLKWPFLFSLEFLMHFLFYFP